MVDSSDVPTIVVNTCEPVTAKSIESIRDSYFNELLNVRVTFASGVNTSE